MASDAIWTPNGVVPVDGKKIDQIRLRPQMIEWFRQFADFAAYHRIGIHCEHCGCDLVARCADSDATFSTTCGCREWIGANREYLKPMPW